MSLPRILSLSPQDELQTIVSPVTRALRGAHPHVDLSQSSSQRSTALDKLSINNLAAELEMELLPKSDAFTLKLQSYDGAVFATIEYSVDAGKRQLRINDVTAPLTGSPGSPVLIRMFLDGSVLEVFANDTTALTVRAYQNSSPRLRLALEGNAQITSLNIWQINPISSDRLTGSFCSQASSEKSS
jgi:beta-fructofuranosidase